MKEEYVKLIVERDSILSEQRKEWLDCKTLAEKEKWMKKINGSLDERYRLMVLRDSQ